MTVAVARFARHAGSRDDAPSLADAPRYLLYLAAALAVVRAPLDGAALANATFLANTMLARHGVPLVFGPETAFAGASSGALGWLGALLLHACLAIPGGAVVVAAASLIATLALVAARTQQHAGRSFGTLAACIAALCCCDAAHAGGTLVAPLFAALLLWLLDRPSSSRAWCSIALIALWSNLAPSGLCGAALAVCVAAGAVLDRSARRQRMAAWLAAAGGCAALLATPAGTAYPLLALHALRLGGGFEEIAKFRPSDVAPLAYHVGFMIVIALGLTCGVRALGWKGIVPALLALGLGLANGAYLPLFGVAAAPLVVAGIASLARGAAARRSSLWAERLTLTAVVVAAFAFTLAPRDRVAAERARTETVAADLAIRGVTLAGAGRLYCAQPAWCSYAVAAGGRVFLDERFAAAPRAAREAQVIVDRADARWPRTVARYGIDALLLDSDSAIAALVRLAPGWRAAGERDGLVLFVSRVRR